LLIIVTGDDAFSLSAVSGRDQLVLIMITPQAETSNLVRLIIFNFTEQLSGHLKKLKKVRRKVVFGRRNHISQITTSGASHIPPSHPPNYNTKTFASQSEIAATTES
jgi:hypothetical protein